MSPSRASSRPRDQIRISWLACGFLTTEPPITQCLKVQDCLFRCFEIEPWKRGVKVRHRIVTVCLKSTLKEDLNYAFLKEVKTYAVM